MRQPIEGGSVLGQPDISLRLRQAFPRMLLPHVNEALAIIPPCRIPLAEREIGRVNTHGETLHIPYRISSPVVTENDVAALSDAPREILACLYTRHHDGFVRQMYVPQLVPSTAEWVAPFVLQLLGEYVVEIALIIERHVETIPKESYRLFAAENPEFMRLTKQRIHSYHACYYRGRFPLLREYPAVKVFEALGL